MEDLEKSRRNCEQIRREWLNPATRHRTETITWRDEGGETSFEWGHSVNFISIMAGKGKVQYIYHTIQPGIFARFLWLPFRL